MKSPRLDPPDRRPNILLLFTDQQRHDTIAALGNRHIRTPVLDRLVHEGTSFLRCYTPSPVCVPARFAMMTGLPPHVTGCVDNGIAVQARISFVERLAAAGYQTHGVGKMHFTPDWRRSWGFGSRDSSEEVQEGHDYRRFVEASGYGHVFELSGLRGEYYYLPQPSQLPAHLHETAWVADRSIDFLQRRERRRPFFLMASFIKPHPPFENPAPWHRLYRCTDLPPPHLPPDYRDYWSRINVVQNRYKYIDQVGPNDRLLRTMKSAYYGAVSFIDHHIGRILRTLEAAGELDRTLVVFTSDHGEMLGDYLCFGKRCMLEASVRVPLVVRWPRLFPENRRCRVAVSLLDLYPTFLDAAGIESATVHPEGCVLGEIVRQPDRRRIVFSQFQHGWIGHYLASDGEWKLHRSTADRKEWLSRANDRGNDGRNQIRSDRHQGIRTRLFDALVERYRGLPHLSPFLGRRWRCHKIPPFSTDPDYGLLRQDEPSLARRLQALGPYVRIPPSADPSPRILTDHMA